MERESLDRSGFRYDIFLSYTKEDVDAVQKLAKAFREHGIRTFFAPEDMVDKVGTGRWEEAIFDALAHSRHLGVYTSIKGLTSGWVRSEIQRFRSAAEVRPEPSRLIFVLRAENMTDDDLDKLPADVFPLRDILRPADERQALQILTQSRMEQSRQELAHAVEELDRAQSLARQSLEYVRHSRFWKPFVTADLDLHIFTCGRDTVQETTTRGHGGRTNIDIWDYRAAVDITHHFARNHREIGVHIEQPVSKERITKETRSFDTGPFRTRLADQNCVVIGSPDVSDFAEITLAELVGVRPYQPDTILSSGFTIVKHGERMSAFYASPGPGESEGIRIVDPVEGTTMYENEPGRTYGVMVYAENPHSRVPGKGKILILAGHTGIATRAMSLLVTNSADWCMSEFHRMDEQVAVLGLPVAVVVEVRFSERLPHDAASEVAMGDTREIGPDADNIRFCRAFRLRGPRGRTV